MRDFDRLGDFIQVSDEADAAGGAALAVRYKLAQRSLAEDQLNDLSAGAELLVSLAQATEPQASMGASGIARLRGGALRSARRLPALSGETPSSLLMRASADLKALRQGEPVEAPRLMELVQLLEQVMRGALSSARQIRQHASGSGDF